MNENALRKENIERIKKKSFRRRKSKYVINQLFWADFSDNISLFNMYIEDDDILNIKTTIENEQINSDT